MSKSSQPLVTRTAPIAIAPKPAQPPYRQDSRDSYRHGSMPGQESTDASYTGRAPSPCDICQRFRIKCTLSDDDEEGCLPCQNRGSECSFVSSPPGRKRKLNGALADDGKRRSVPRPLRTVSRSFSSFPVLLVQASQIVHFPRGEWGEEEYLTALGREARPVYFSARSSVYMLYLSPADPTSISLPWLGMPLITFIIHPLALRPALST